MRVTFTSLTDVATSTWEQIRQALADDLKRLQSTINTTWDVAHHADGTQRAAATGVLLGQLSGTLAEQPTGLTTENDGLLYFVTDYGHLVRWNGSTLQWQFAPGDNGPGEITGFAFAPLAPSSWWQLCDGSATTYLTVGGTLGTGNFTTPNLTGSPSYLKFGAAYAGIAGPTAPGATMSGSTANESAHTHADGSYKVSISVTTAAAGTDVNVFTPGGGIVPNPSDVDVTGTSAAGSAHGHGVGTLAATIDTTGEPRRSTLLPYFRR